MSWLRLFLNLVVCNLIVIGKKVTFEAETWKKSWIDWNMSIGLDEMQHSKLWRSQMKYCHNCFSWFWYLTESTRVSPIKYAYFLFLKIVSVCCKKYQMPHHREKIRRWGEKKNIFLEKKLLIGTQIICSWGIISLWNKIAIDRLYREHVSPGENVGSGRAGSIKYIGLQQSWISHIQFNSAYLLWYYALMCNKEVRDYVRHCVLPWGRQKAPKCTGTSLQGVGLSGGLGLAGDLSPLL